MYPRYKRSVSKTNERTGRAEKKRRTATAPHSQVRIPILTKRRSWARWGGHDRNPDLRERVLIAASGASA
jgi:hypothetical protein